MRTKRRHTVRWQTLSQHFSVSFDVEHLARIGDVLVRTKDLIAQSRALLRPPDRTDLIAAQQVVLRQSKII
jgi:hypothetical protein